MRLSGAIRVACPSFFSKSYTRPNLLTKFVAMKNSCFFIFILLIAACSKGYGEKIERGNTTVFYIDKNEKVLAEKFLAFWIDKKIAGKEKQFIRILKQKDCFHLQLIAKDEFKPTALPFEEMKLFTKLQAELNKSVFTSLPCKIILCDGNFKEIYTPVSE
jgi:hypothetical protein